MGAQRGGFVRSKTGTPHSEPFDELSARIFVPCEPRTRDTQRNPREDEQVKAPYRVLERAVPPLSHRTLSAMSATNTITP